MTTPANAEVVIGVDLGGTRMRAARLDGDLNMHMRQETLTHAAEGFDATLARMKLLIRSVLPEDGAPVSGIGVSIPGPTNPFIGVVELGTNLKGWHGVPLKDLLMAEFGVPVYLGNDANVAALAETAIGAARGYRHVIFITVSTGIGGGVIVDGHLLLGHEGLAAEVGHLVLAFSEGELRLSTLEKEAAGPALARQARAAIEAGEPTLMHELVGGDLNRLSGKVVGDAASQGDAVALRIVRRAGTVLGAGVASLLHTFNPQIVVFGGAVSNIGDLLFDPMRETIERVCIDDAYWRNLRLTTAALGEDVSLIGAGALVITHGGADRPEDVIRALND
jgi:glucokinase